MRDEQLVPLVKAAPAEPEVDDALARLTLADLRQLPQALAQPQAVLLDASSNALVYVFDSGRRGGWLSLIVNYLLQGRAAPSSPAAWSASSSSGSRANGRLVLVEGGL